MSVTDLTVLSPLLITGTAVLVLMLAAAWEQSPRSMAIMTVSFLFLALVTIPSLISLIPRHVTPLIIIDGYGVFFMVLVLGASLAVTAQGFGYWNQIPIRHGEFYLLVLLATLGAEVLVTANHFASLFLGLELLSVSLYGLVAYARRAHRALEAGIKYLILSAAASTFVLFGMAVIYFDRGSMDFPDLSPVFLPAHHSEGMVPAGLVMVLIGIVFKLGLFPFHMWTPDVYEGAPAPATAFIATVSKGAVIGLFLRVYLQMGPLQNPSMMTLLSGVAIGSMFVGNWSALLQDNIKRLLAYSSIAHMGYLLVALLASGALAVEAVGYYLVAYIPTTLGAFGVVQALSSPGNDADSLEQYRGLLWRNPGLAVMFIIMMLSLAGIPLTAGFLAKFYVVTAGLTAQLWMLVFLFILNSVIGLFYYLRIIRFLISDAPANTVKPLFPVALPLGTTLTLGSLTVLVILFGIYPDPVMQVLQHFSRQLTG
jgi:NADH-quinone oxidoreductase subunit N